MPVELTPIGDSLGEILLDDVKRELRVTHDTDDDIITNQINEAVEYLNKFLDEGIEDASDLTPSQKRYIYIRVALTYMGPDEAMERAEGQVLEMIRER